MKKIVTVAFAMMLALGLTGCGNSASGGDDAVSGTVNLNGSTSMEELVKYMIESMKETNPGLTINAEYTGSSSGTKAAMAGTADIGNASRNLKDEEKEVLTENIVAIDGIAVIVGADVDAPALTMDQLAQIYKGEVKNWSELGGADLPIVVIGRDSASGTRGAFEEIVGVEGVCAYAQEIESTGAVIGSVGQTAGAIGYVSLNVVDSEKSVKALDLDGAAASAENIKAGTYPLSRPFVMATKGAIEDQKDEVKVIFDWINGETGQQVIADLGLISAK